MSQNAPIKFNITRRVSSDKKFYVGRFNAPTPPVWRKGSMKKVVGRRKVEKDEDEEKEKRPESRFMKRKREEKRFLQKPRNETEFRFKDNANGRSFVGTLDKPHKSCTYVMFEVLNNNEVQVYPVEICKFHPESQVVASSMDEQKRREQEVKQRDKLITKKFTSRMKRFNAKTEQTSKTMKSLKEGVSKKSELNEDGTSAIVEEDDGQQEKGEKKGRIVKKRKKNTDDGDGGVLGLTRNDLREGDDAQNEEAGDFDQNFSDDENDAVDEEDLDADSLPLGFDSEEERDDGMAVDDDFDRIEKDDKKISFLKLLRDGPKEKKEENDDMEDDENEEIKTFEFDRTELESSEDEEEGSKNGKSSKQESKSGKGKDVKSKPAPKPAKKAAPQRSKLTEKYVINLVKSNKRMTVQEFLNKMQLSQLDTDTKDKLSRLMRKIFIIRPDPGTKVKFLYLKDGV